MASHKLVAPQTVGKGSGSSEVGNQQIYEADDQRSYSHKEFREKERLKEAIPPSAHDIHGHKDHWTIANKAAREDLVRAEKRYNPPDPKQEEEQLSKKDPTLPAQLHGDTPSKGAKVDKELQEEDQDILKKKGSWGPKVDKQCMMGT